MQHRYEDVARGVTKHPVDILSPRAWRYARSNAREEDGRPCFSCLTHIRSDGLGPLLLRYTFATPRSDGQTHRESETQ